MKREVLFMVMLSLIALPTGIPAQTQNEHSQHMMPQHGDPGDIKKTRTRTIMLGEQTVEGVKAKALLNDVGAMMAQMGRKENFHFMVMFADTKTGAAIDQGTVAVKITDKKTGQIGEAIPLMSMSGHFGADIILPAKGEYHLQVGSKLADGSIRQFNFQYTVQ